MKYIKLLVVSSIPLLFTGCSIFGQTAPVCPEQKNLYNGTFDTSLFETRKPMIYKYWVDKLDENRTIIVQDEEDFYKSMEEVGILKENYNLLLMKITEFNLKINPVEGK
jgi:hypothetical protein